MNLLKSAGAALAALAAMLGNGCGNPSTTGDDSNGSEEALAPGVDLVRLVRLVSMQGVQDRRPTPVGGGYVIPENDAYLLISVLTRIIERSPGDPVVYDLRANLWGQVGWRHRAEQDRAAARNLRVRGATSEKPGL